MKKFISTLFALGLLLALFNTVKAQSFDDVYEYHMNVDAIDFLQESNVIEGYNDGSFKPENRINRAEFMKIIVASQVDEPTGENCFPDVKNEWFAKYICTAKNLGWIAGHPDGTFKPSEYINFAEASKIITKSLDVPATDVAGTKGEWFAGFVKGLEKKHAIPTTVQFFDKDISRGEMTEVIWRLKEKIEDKVSLDYESITKEFPQIKSCAALKDKFDIYQSQYGYRNYFMEEGMIMDLAMPTAMPMAKMVESSLGMGGGIEADDFSSTNIQVEGVDEADIIKNDGKYIYMIKDSTIRIIEAYPPVLMKQVGELDFYEEGFVPEEMYIHDDQLIIIGRTLYEQYYKPIAPENIGLPMISPPSPYYRGTKTKVYLFDVSDRSNPTEERVITFDGFYQSSRRIKDNLYMVLNDSPNVWIMDDVERGEDLLLYLKDGEKQAEPMVGCTDIRYFPGHAKPNYLITVSIPLDDPEGEIDREVFLGSGENVYSSRTHLYVATSQTNFDRYTDWDWGNDRTNTLVYKFSLDDGDIDYVARGKVPGRILNQFSMDAHINHFRIATTQGQQWNERNPSSNNVYILDREMKRVGEIEDIAPGERIFSTRFLGNRLYMVTFKKVDPLFVIDLKDPTNPKILGKLKIPGFSDYLHPFDENHIIGFGKDTIEADKGDFAWYQGFKMALFDVSDVTNPKQKFVELIGDRGTDSELLRNHKALLFDKEKELLAFPIQIQEENETIFSGAVVYNLNATEGFNERGRITHYTEEDLLKMGDYWPYNHDNAIQRIIYMGNFLYSISQGTVKASTITDVSEVKAIDLD